MLDIIGLAECVVLYLYCLFRHKMFLGLASLIINMIIIVFNYDVILLINMFYYGYAMLCMLDTLIMCFTDFHMFLLS